MSQRVEGWDAIAGELNRSVRWAKTASCRESDPLPVHYQGRVPWTTRAELDAWWRATSVPARERLTYLAGLRRR